MKMRVVCTRMPSSVRRRIAMIPSSIIGSLMMTLSATFASSRPSRYMPSASTDATSVVTGPLTSRQTSASNDGMSPFESWAPSRDGLVVTPSIRPEAAAQRISSRLPVSRKIFMSAKYRARVGSGYGQERARGRALELACGCCLPRPTTSASCPDRDDLSRSQSSCPRGTEPCDAGTGSPRSRT